MLPAQTSIDKQQLELLQSCIILNAGETQHGHLLLQDEATHSGGCDSLFLQAVLSHLFFSHHHGELYMLRSSNPHVNSVPCKIPHGRELYWSHHVKIVNFAARMKNQHPGSD